MIEKKTSVLRFFLRSTKFNPKFIFFGFIEVGSFLYLEFSAIVLKRVLPLSIELLNISVFADSAQIPITPPYLNSQSVQGKEREGFVLERFEASAFSSEGEPSELGEMPMSVKITKEFYYFGAHSITTANLGMI
ncbi:MAG: hypothetical protein JJ971_09460 [Balneolaceae bacterium]|nr:hypothetical protein [Balneolaceae bacterium]MBO6546528.1 hypothetical protein [Balneolaceae bacterium]MBO6648887.1 hypothetical protein [Balneolaceae bacterium]